MEAKNFDEKSAIYKLWNLKKKKNLNQFCKMNLKADEAYLTVKFFICSPDKASIYNLLLFFANFQPLASNSLTPELQLHWRMVFILSMMVDWVIKSEPSILYQAGELL